MGLRQRSGFDGLPQHDNSREELNLTKYDERYIMPTDGRAFMAQNDGGSSAYSTPLSPVDTQSPVAQPAPPPVYRDRNYVFGGEQPTDPAFAAKSDERSYVFGNPSDNQPSAPANVEPVAGGGAYSQGNGAYSQGNGAYLQGNGAQPVNRGERPMVFVLRDDRNMFVYEYSDRLEYYRRTEYGMSYCATKFKNLSR